jgi:hypothetical protein
LEGLERFLWKRRSTCREGILPLSAGFDCLQANGIKNSIEYRTWAKRPDKLPARPDQYYRNEWSSWKSFLGEHYAIPKRQVYSKLKESDVRIIKHQLKLGVSGAALARTFGVSEMQISRIKKGENWAEV